MTPVDLTILIPTRNRPAFLRRALRYYAHHGWPSPILVCDSSDTSGKPAIAAVLREAPANVALLDSPPDIGVNAKIIAGLERVATKYLAFCGDDDFVVPQALPACVDYLEAHPDFSAAHGQAFTFVIEGAVAHGRIATLRPYRQRALLDDSPAARLRSHFADWTTSFYSVQRTASVRSIFDAFGRMQNDSTCCEIFFYAANAIRGKAVRLDRPYMYRQIDIAKEYSVDETHVWADAPGGAAVRAPLVAELTRELIDAGEPAGGAELLVRRLLQAWIDGRRPFRISRWRDYAPRYYWDRLLNLGHKAGFRCREYRSPGPDGRIVREFLAADTGTGRAGAAAA